MNKKKKSIMFLIFIVGPIILTLILIFNFNNLLNLDIIEKGLSVSGYLFSLSSLILVFVVFKNLKASDYKKVENDENYLNNEAINELSSSISTIQICLKYNKVEGLEKSCRSVIHIHRSLNEYTDDVYLKNFSSQIKTLHDLVNRHKLISIGYDCDYEKLGKIRSKTKLTIIDKIDFLDRNLQNMIKAK